MCSSVSAPINPRPAAFSNPAISAVYSSAVQQKILVPSTVVLGTMPPIASSLRVASQQKTQNATSQYADKEV